MAPPQNARLVPTVAEILKDPAFPTAIFNLEPDQSGLLPVAEGRGGPFNLSWEIHGHGPIKLVLIMGLASLKTSWQRQTLHFGHQHASEYSVLVIDNRGMGDSDKPLMRYSSSEMASDLIEVLTHVGWLRAQQPSTSEARNLHVVGISLGGMIAQELACRIPTAISSLSLICTAAAIENTTTWAENMANRVSMLVPKSVDRSVNDTASQIFSHEWLAQPDDAVLPDPSTTPKCLPPAPGPHIIRASEVAADASAKDVAGGMNPTNTPTKYLGFQSNAHRFVAQEMHKRLDAARFGIKGFLLQLIAAGWHHKSAEQLKEMADKVGRERILVMHGDADRMISVPHGRKLIEYIEPGVGKIVEGMGHAPLVEKCGWFNKTIEERCALGERLDGRA